MQKNNSTNLVLLLIIITAVIGGGIAPLSKIALQEMPPITFTFFRSLASSLFILPLFIHDIRRKAFVKKDAWKLIGASSLGVVNLTFFSIGIQYTTPTVSQTLFTASPIVAAIFSYLLIKEAVGKRKLTGILLGFVGTLIIIFAPTLGGVQQSLQSTQHGNLMICIAVLGFSLYTVLSKPLHKVYSPIVMTSAFIFLTTVIEFALLWLEPHPAISWSFGYSLQALVGAALVGFLSFVFYTIYQQVIKRSTPITASMVSYLMLLSVYLWTKVLLQETLTQSFLIGAALVVAGAWIVTHANLRSRS